MWPRPLSSNPSWTIVTWSRQRPTRQPGLRIGDRTRGGAGGGAAISGSLTIKLAASFDLADNVGSYYLVSPSVSLQSVQARCCNLANAIGLSEATF